MSLRWILIFYIFVSILLRFFSHSFLFSFLFFFCLYILLKKRNQITKIQFIKIYRIKNDKNKFILIIKKNVLRKSYIKYITQFRCNIKNVSFYWCYYFFMFFIVFFFSYFSIYSLSILSSDTKKNINKNFSLFFSFFVYI